jgi:tetratricopeptide (TPR) repeat protein
MWRAAIVVLLVAAPAAAQTDQERALTLFEESRGHYDAGRFDRAIELLQEAYRLQPEPILLYNMGRAYEGADQVREAADAYERYLNDAGDVRDRGALEARLRTLRERIAREDAERDRPAPPPPPPSGGVDPGGWIVLGVGVAAIAVGVVLGVLSDDAHNEAVAAPVHRDAVALQQSAYDYASGANAAFIAGGVIAVAGLVWGIVSIASGGPRSSAQSPLVIRF